VVDAVRSNQLNRALRIDKLTLLALEETLRLYRDEKTAVKEIPTLRMICRPYRSLAKKAERLIQLVGKVRKTNFSMDLSDGVSKVGGGALPLLELPTRLVCLVPGAMSSRSMENFLRFYDPPVIARVEKERVLLDVRTIQEREMKTVAQAVKDLALVE
jgi:L-seryl-tRNA(Ser) seleniumtransferase